MNSKILFASVLYNTYDADQTLPAKFSRMIDAMELRQKVNGKITAIKMHVGREIGYTTIHPLFIKTLVDKLKQYGANVYITDQTVEGAAVRGYREEFFGCPIVDACGATGKYFYQGKVDFKTFRNMDIAGNIQDAEFMIDLSHIKGHGCCGYGGSCKNLAMGCVTTRTRQQIHGLEGGLKWDEDACIHCDACIKGCNHNANGFTHDGKYDVNFHHCTFCQHCVKVCPTGAIVMDANRYNDFQTGMAISTKAVLDTFEKDCVYYINFLTNITALCDCWGLSTPPIVPDIGIMSSWDIVAIERACVDAIKNENLLISGVPQSIELGTKGHLLERLHGKDPFIQISKLEELGLGQQKYDIIEIF